MHGWGVGGWRLVRAFALTATALFLSCAAHVLGGGQAPSFLHVVGIGAPILVVAFLMAGRRRGPVTVGTALVLGQATVHAFLMLVSRPVALGPVPGGHMMAHSVQVTTGAISGAGAPVHPGPTLSMVAWHALAATATAAGLAFGERAAWYLVGWALPPTPQVVRLATPTAVSPLHAGGHPVVLRQPWLQSVSLRGPPPAAAANPR